MDQLLEVHNIGLPSSEHFQVRHRNTSKILVLRNASDLPVGNCVELTLLHLSRAPRFVKFSDSDPPQNQRSPPQPEHLACPH
jgi:hypothetical protein